MAGAEKSCSDFVKDEGNEMVPAAVVAGQGNGGICRIICGLVTTAADDGFIEALPFADPRARGRWRA